MRVSALSPLFVLVFFAVSGIAAPIPEPVPEPALFPPKIGVRLGTLSHVWEAEHDTVHSAGFEYRGSSRDPCEQSQLQEQSSSRKALSGTSR